MTREKGGEVAELKARLAEQERRIAELEARNAELEDYVQSLGHDLRSPLVTIEGFLSFLRRDALAGNLDRLEHDIERIGRATAQLQIFAIPVDGGEARPLTDGPGSRRRDASVYGRAGPKVSDSSFGEPSVRV